MRKMLVMVLALFPVAATAHVGDHGLLNWQAGFLHPLTGLDHALALVAIGVWLAQSESRGRSWFLAGFAGILAAAIGLGSQFTNVRLESGIIATLLILGALMVAAVRGPMVLRAGIIGATAAIHGFVHGTELPAGDGSAAFAVSLVLSSLLVMSLAMAVGTQSQRFANGLFARIAGALLMVLGVGMAV